MLEEMYKEAWSPHLGVRGADERRIWERQLRHLRLLPVLPSAQQLRDSSKIFFSQSWYDKNRNSVSDPHAVLRIPVKKLNMQIQPIDKVKDLLEI
jgi:hypothetical protein